MTKPWRRRTKYGNKPTPSKFTNRIFQSRLEASREPVLIALQNAGLIRDLRYQVPYAIELYGTQAVDALLAELERQETTPGWPMALVALARDVRRSRQKICVYRADFVYESVGTGDIVVEDTKGFATPEYKLKKKLIAISHNIEIVEPNVSGVQQKARGAGVRGAGTGSRFRGGK